MRWEMAEQKEIWPVEGPGRSSKKVLVGRSQPAEIIGLQP